MRKIMLGIMIGVILTLVLILICTLIFKKAIKYNNCDYTCAGCCLAMVSIVLLAFLFTGSFILLSDETEYKENAYAQKSTINISAANLLKSADSILTFVDKKTETYKEIMESITAARTGNGSIERVYTIIHENYPTDMEMGKQWQSYIKSIDTAYNSILDAQVGYNEAVKQYRSLFTPFNKIFLGHGPDESIQYFSLDYEIDYTVKN